MSVMPAALLARAPEGGPGVITPPGDPEVRPYLQPGRRPLESGDDADEQALKRNDAFISRRTAGDVRLTVKQAGKGRAIATRAAKHLKKQPPT